MGRSESMGAYIINIPDSVDRVVYINVNPMNGKTYTASYSVENLTPYTEPDLEQVRKEAYKKGFDDGRTLNTGKYEKGLNDAWECARKIASDNAGQNYSIFGQHFTIEILNTHSASEAIKKIRQYEQEQDRQARIEYNFDEIKDVLETTAKECNVSLDEIAEVLQKMKEANNG